MGDRLRASTYTMSDSKLADWNGDGAMKEIKGGASDWITRACIIVKRRAVTLLSTPGTGREGSSGPEVSQPGKPPRKQTGNLRDHVDYEVDEDELVGRVGTNIDYGRYLELG